jgi:hypothetical protein
LNEIEKSNSWSYGIIKEIQELQNPIILKHPHWGFISIDVQILLIDGDHMGLIEEFNGLAPTAKIRGDYQYFIENTLFGHPLLIYAQEEEMKRYLKDTRQMNEKIQELKILFDCNEKELAYKLYKSELKQGRKFYFTPKEFKIHSQDSPEMKKKKKKDLEDWLHQKESLHLNLYYEYALKQNFNVFERLSPSIFHIYFHQGLFTHLVEIFLKFTEDEDQSVNLINRTLISLQVKNLPSFSNREKYSISHWEIFLAFSTIAFENLLEEDLYTLWIKICKNIAMTFWKIHSNTFVETFKQEKYEWRNELFERDVDLGKRPKLLHDSRLPYYFESYGCFQFTDDLKFESYHRDLLIFLRKKYDFSYLASKYFQQSSIHWSFEIETHLKLRGTYFINPNTSHTDPSFEKTSTTTGHIEFINDIYYYNNHFMLNDEISFFHENNQQETGSIVLNYGRLCKIMKNYDKDMKFINLKLEVIRFEILQNYSEMLEYKETEIKDTISIDYIQNKISFVYFKNKKMINSLYIKKVE